MNNEAITTVEEPARAPDKKIIFTGLDNGGKTSILLMLQRKLAKIATLTPTKLVERNTFDYLGGKVKIAAHDLGGQKKYLITYLKQPGKYFADTDIVIYVIDVQDPARYKETISYFGDVLDELDDLGIKPLVYVLFHKAEKILIDGDQESDTRLPGSGMHDIQTLQRAIEDANAGRHDLQLKLTTIFDPWSITSTFSDIMLRLYPRTGLIDDSLKDFAVSSNLDALLLLDSNSLALAEYYTDDAAKRVLKASTPYFLTLLDAWQPLHQDSKTKRQEMRVMLDAYSFTFVELLKDGNPTSLFFLAMSQEALVSTDRLDEFSDVVLGILKI